MQCDTCRFCMVVDGVYSFPLIDTPVFENEKVVVFASVGALVEGWSIVALKEHLPSVSTYYSDKGFKETIDFILSKYQKKYESVYIFEHGCSTFDSLTGCGVNHSHIHIVPFSQPISNIVELDSSWRECSLSSITTLCKDREYHLITQLSSPFILENAIFHVKIIDDPESQFFRKAIAKSIGESEFDYNKNMRIELSQKTHMILKSLFSGDDDESVY